MATTTELRDPTPYYVSPEYTLSLQKSSLNGKDTLPEGFPKSIESSLVWTGAEMEKKRDEWCLVLRKEDIESLENALRHFDSCQISPSELDSRTFPLEEGLANRLRSISYECYSGRGFVVIQGLDPTKYSEEQNAILFIGISTYVAPQRGFQDTERSHVLAHIYPKTAVNDINTVKQTPAFVDGAMAFHTDSGDVLALYSMNVDAAGRLLLASSCQVYNELAANRPDIIHLLSEDWVMDTYKDYAMFPPQTMPLLYSFDDKVILNVSRYSITGIGAIQRNPDLPPVTEAQLEALNAIHILGLKNGFALPNEPGDIVYINNMAMIHGREAMNSSNDVKTIQRLSKRHKMRLHLRDPQRAWKLPRQLQPVWDNIYGPNQEDGSRKESWMLRRQGPESPRWLING